MRIFTMKDNQPIDFCYLCAPESEEVAEVVYGELNGFDCDHPPYEDDEYSCYECGVELTEVDD